MSDLSARQSSFGIISFIVGVVSIIFTIKTWANTKDIAQKVAAAKIKEIYPNRHPIYVQALETAQIALSEGSRQYYIISELLKNCRDIQKYYDNWENEEKKAIDKFTKGLDKIPANRDIDERTRIKLQKELFELQPMIERIGKLNGIG